MRKHILLLCVTLMLAFALTGCKEQETVPETQEAAFQTVQATTVETTVPTEPLPTVIEAVVDGVLLDLEPTEAATQPTVPATQATKPVTFETEPPETQAPATEPPATEAPDSPPVSDDPSGSGIILGENEGDIDLDE